MRKKILPTIRSRTQIFNFKKQEEKLIHQLEQAGLVKKKATLLAQFCQSHAEAEKTGKSGKFLDLGRWEWTPTDLVISQEKKKVISKLLN